MRGADTAKWVARWRAEVERETDERARGIVVALALTFSELTQRQVLWRRGLEGMNVEHSQFVLEWEQRGELRGLRKALVDLLQARFGVDLPTDLRQMVDNQEDLPKLTAWFHAALTAKSLKALRKAWASA